MSKNITLYKIRYYSTLCLFVLFTILLFISSGCQDESEEITPPPSEKAITPNSKLADYISRIALNDGSFDNIIDKASCTQLVLPVTVIVNGQEVQINSADDFKIIEGILDESENDNDTLNIVLPVTVTRPDHTQVVISSYEGFRDIADECLEGGHDEDIECIDFQYPLTLSIYDSNLQLFNTAVIETDQALFKVFENLDEGLFASFKFPVTLIVYGGAEIVINNHDELEDAIEDNIDGCDEDDDNDHNDDDADDTELISVLSGADWRITYCFGRTDETDLFSAFVIALHENGTIVASDGASSVDGEWDTNGDDGTLVLDLQFREEPPFDRLPEIWAVVEFNNSLIKLKNIDKGDGLETTMVIEKI